MILKNKMHKEEIIIDFPNNSIIALMVGNHSVNLTKLEKLIDININLFGNQFIISGELTKITLTKTILTNVYNKIAYEKINNLNFEFSDFETELRMLNGKGVLRSPLGEQDETNEQKFQT